MKAAAQQDDEPDAAVVAVAPTSVLSCKERSLDAGYRRTVRRPLNLYA